MRIGYTRLESFGLLQDLPRGVVSAESTRWTRQARETAHAPPPEMMRTVRAVRSTNHGLLCAVRETPQNHVLAQP